MHPVNVAPDEYICLFESDSVVCSDYETEIMAFTDHMSGLLKSYHRLAA
jgi:hypothetical protein